MFVMEQLLCNLLFRIPESLLIRRSILNKNIRVRHFYSKNKAALDRFTVVSRKVNNPQVDSAEHQRCAQEKLRKFRDEKIQNCITVRSVILQL